MQNCSEKNIKYKLYGKITENQLRFNLKKINKKNENRILFLMKFLKDILPKLQDKEKINCLTSFKISSSLY